MFELILLTALLSTGFSQLLPLRSNPVPPTSRNGVKKTEIGCRVRSDLPGKTRQGPRPSPENLTAEPFDSLTRRGGCKKIRVC